MKRTFTKYPSNYVKASTEPSLGQGPILVYNGERIRRTNLLTYYARKDRIVYEDVDKVDSQGNKKLYFKYDNGLHGVWLEDCYENFRNKEIKV